MMNKEIRDIIQEKIYKVVELPNNFETFEVTAYLDWCTPELFMENSERRFNLLLLPSLFSQKKIDRIKTLLSENENYISFKRNFFIKKEAMPKISLIATWDSFSEIKVNWVLVTIDEPFNFTMRLETQEILEILKNIETIDFTRLFIDFDAEVRGRSQTLKSEIRAREKIANIFYDAVKETVGEERYCSQRLLFEMGVRK